MKIINLLVILFGVNSAYANLNQAPPNLSIENNNTIAVFVDFESATTEITYDLFAGEARAKTKINFYQPKTGKPVFDLVPAEEALRIDGEVSSSKTMSMAGTSKVKYVDKVIHKGHHTLEIENIITSNISVKGWTQKKSLRAAFWMSDLTDRNYLEQYLPTNLEYDQYQATIEYKIIGTDDEHVIYTNGDVDELEKNRWRVKYPATFSASSYYMHISEAGLNNEQREFYHSIDGRDIPILIYSRQYTSKYMERAKKVLAELERDYGPWPHPQLIVYGAGSGGMEHAGATITSYDALGHELIHSYFARGVMPSHGNSGWVDEAIASWRDIDYRQYSKYTLVSTSMGGHSVYRRHTDKAAYKMGRRFMGHLDEKFEKKGGLKKFLKDFFEHRKFKPFKTSDFQAALETYFNTDVRKLFKEYIYGDEASDSDHFWKDFFDKNPHHPELSEQDLLDLL